MEGLKEEVIEILRQQLQLLSEKSKEKDITARDLECLSVEVDKISQTIIRAISHSECHEC